MTSRSTPLRELSSARCWELLAVNNVGRLVVAFDGQPDVFPVNYALSDKQLILRTDSGKLLDKAMASEAVAFEVDALNDSARTGWSIVVKGTISETQTTDDSVEAVASRLEPWVDGPKDRFLVLRPETVTGRVLPPATSGVVMRTNSKHER